MKNLSNRTLLDLGKVSYADFVYRNDKTKHEWKEKPTKLWFNGEYYDPLAITRWYDKKKSEWVTTTIADWFKMTGNNPDTFTPVFKAQLTNSHTLEFTGKKAHQLWALYRKRIGIKKAEAEAKPKKGRLSKNPTKDQPSMQLDLL